MSHRILQEIDDDNEKTSIEDDIVLMVLRFRYDWLVHMTKGSELLALIDGHDEGKRIT